MIAYKNDTKLKSEILVDEQHKGLLEHYSWGLDSDGYPKAKIGSVHMRLHRAVVGAPPSGLVTDHINENKLDNRRANLRFVSLRENALNSTKKGDGVWFNKNKNRWQAQHKVNGVRNHLGTFKSFEEASASYQRYAKKLLKLLKEEKKSS